MNKKNKLTSLIIIVIFSSTFIMKAQTTTEEITDEFFKIYEKTPQMAIENVYATNKWIQKRGSHALTTVSIKANSKVKDIGHYYGYEKINEISEGESYKRVDFMLKYEKEPIRIIFVFYKPKDKWNVQSFNIGNSF